MFYVVDHVQGSEEWLRWRRSRVTATMPAAIMGESPWVTPNQLWRDICLGETKEFFKPAIERGKKLETPARLWIEHEMGVRVEAGPCVENGSNGRHAASLDGVIGLKLIDDVKQLYKCDAIVEIKVPGERTHSSMMKGDIPIYYRLQVLWQMYVTDCKTAYIASFDGFEGIILPVEWDDELISRMVKEVEHFLHFVDDFEEPPLCGKDWDHEDDSKILETAKEYSDLLDQKKQIDYELKVRRTSLEEAAKGRVRVVFGPIRYTQSVRKGNIDYSLVPELEGIDLEPYRGSPITTTTLRKS